MSVKIWGYDGDASEWRRVAVDSSGKLQVNNTDVETLLAGGLPAALDTGALKVREQADPIARLYGWDGSVWQKLLTESNALFNLRVKLYDGASGMQSQTGAGDITAGNIRLQTASVLYGFGGSNFSRIQASALGADAIPTSDIVLAVRSHLFGFNGTTWDRLRVESNTAFNLRVKLYDGAGGMGSVYNSLVTPYTTRGLVAYSVMMASDGSQWAAGSISAPSTDAKVATGYALEVQSRLYGFNGTTWDRLRIDVNKQLITTRGKAGLNTHRRTGTGIVGAGAVALYWLTVHASAANWLLELANQVASGGAVVWSEGGPTAEPCHCSFDPPFEFSTTLRVETITNITAVMFGYK